MNKPLLATLLIIALVSKSIKAESCNDKSVSNSASSSNCHKASASSGHRCCYLEGLDKSGQPTKTCREINKDVSKEEETLAQYVTDFYSEPESPYQFISLIDCEDSLKHDRDYRPSACMTEAKATDIDSCRNRQIKDGNGMCCLLTGAFNGVDVKQCVEIKLNERLDETKNYEKLLNGQYDTRLPKYDSVSSVTCGTPCESTPDPTGLDSCKERAVYSSGEKCCYINGISDNKETKQCINIAVNDGTDIAAKRLTSSGVNGRYPQHKSVYFSDLSELSCGDGFLYKKSPCQSTKASESNDCIDKDTSDNSKYTCAYLRGKHKGEQEEKRECVEIKNEDKDKLDDIDDDIEDGKYFHDYGGEYDDVKVLTIKRGQDHKKTCSEANEDSADDCGDYDGDDNNSECCYVKAKDNKDNTVKKCVSVTKGVGVSVVSTIISQNNFSRVVKLECKNQGKIYEQSSCEDEEPKDSEDCEGKDASDENTEMCCYLSGTDSSGTVKECVDIKIEDVNNITKVQNEIKQGTYWPDFSGTYSSATVICKRNPCGNIDPDDADECFSGDTGVDTTECCYLKARDENDKHGVEKCVPIDKNNFDTNTDISKIISGTYFSGDSTKYSKIRELTCLGKEFYRESDCENENPDKAGDCTGKRTENDDEMCCYLTGKDASGKVEECVDIKLIDVPKIDDVKQKIMQGTYWTDYTEPYTEVNIECRVKNSSGKYLKTSILLLLFALL